MIEYREFNSALIDEVHEIYEANKWESYLGNKEKLARAFDRSLYIIGAFDSEKLVGFARCIGDGEYILYVQDLIVHPSYFRRGIGRGLMKMVSARFPSVRQFVLITDEDDPDSNAFYRAIGLVEKCNGYPVNHYFRSHYNVEGE